MCHFNRAHLLCRSQNLEYYLRTSQEAGNCWVLRCLVKRSFRFCRFACSLPLAKVDAGEPTQPRPDWLPEGCEMLADGEYDAIVMGTGLKEAIMSGLLSTLGMKVTGSIRRYGDARGCSGLWGYD